MIRLVPRGSGWKANLQAAAVFFGLSAIGDLLDASRAVEWRVFAGLGYAFAASLLRGSAIWPGLWLGQVGILLLVLGRREPTVALAAWVAVASLVRALLPLLCALPVRRYLSLAREEGRASGEPSPLLQLRGAIAFLVVGGVVLPLLSAAAIVAWLQVAGMAPGGFSWASFRDLALAGSTGVLLVAPLFLMPRPSRPSSRTPARRLEAIACGAVVVGASTFFFSSRGPGWFGYPPIHLLLPVLLWATLRFGLRGAVYAMAAIGLAGVLPPLGLAPGVDETSHNRLRLLIGLQAATFLLVAVALRDREEARDQARRERDRLEDRVAARTASVRAERAFNDLAIDLLGALVVVFDVRGTVTRINRAFERATGWTPAELIGKPYPVIRPREEHDRARAAIERLRSGHPVESRDVHALGPDGRQIDVEYNSAPIRGADGKVRGILVTAIDYTERNRAIERLEAALSLLRAILEATADGILVLDLDDRVTAFNRRFAALLGIPEAALAVGVHGSAIREYVLPSLADPEAFVARLAWLRDHREAEAVDIVPFRDGRVLERVSRPHRLRGRIVGRVQGYRDVTRRIRAEAERDRLLREEEREHEASARALAAARAALEARDRFFAEAAATLGGTHAELVRCCDALFGMIEAAGEDGVPGREAIATIDAVLAQVTRLDRLLEERLAFLERSPASR